MIYKQLLGIVYFLNAVFAVNGMQQSYQSSPQIISHLRNRFPSVEASSSPSSLSRISTVSSPSSIRSSTSSALSLMPAYRTELKPPQFTTEKSTFLKEMDELPEIAEDKWKQYIATLCNVVISQYTKDKEKGKRFIQLLCEVENCRGNKDLWNFIKDNNISVLEPVKIRGNVSYLEGLSLRNKKIYKMRVKYYEETDWINYLKKQFKLQTINQEILSVLPPHYIEAVDKDPTSKHENKQLWYLADQLVLIIPDYSIKLEFSLSDN